MTDQNRPLPSDPDWDALARFIAGESSATERAELERAMAADPARGPLIGALHRATISPDPAAPASADVERALQSVLARRGEKGTGSSAWRSPIISLNRYRAHLRTARLSAAAGVLVVAGAALIWRASVSPNVVRSPNAIRTRFATAVGGLDSMRLADGSRVLLGPGSEITLGDDFGGSSRELSLKGEARFDVVHDSVHPFVVHTALASFRDVGTVFAIHSDAADGARVEHD